MKAPQINDFACLIGIDWADKKHDYCETDDHGKTHAYGIISSKPEAIHKWVMSLKKRYPNQKIAISCELKKGPLVHALLKYDHISIFSINPSTVAKYRKAFVEWAGQSIRFSFWAKAYYQQQMEKGKPHNTAIRSLAFKWIRIAFKC